LGPETLGEVGAIQQELLVRASRCLKPGARLIYATCTVLRRENEDPFEALMARDPGLERVRLAEIFGSETAAPISDPSGTDLKLLPHRHDTDGFYAAVLRRRRG
jgi:16S rRNA (cytosine967-C5)-methyltransferase